MGSTRIAITENAVRRSTGTRDRDTERGSVAVSSIAPIDCTLPSAVFNFSCDVRTFESRPLRDLTEGIRKDLLR
jgi:hypothetical protein